MILIASSEFPRNASALHRNLPLIQFDDQVLFIPILIPSRCIRLILIPRARSHTFIATTRQQAIRFGDVIRNQFCPIFASCC